MSLQERYTPIPLAANGSYTFTSGSPTGVAAFIAVTGGTVTVTNRAGVVLLNAFPVAAGVYYPLVFYAGNEAVVVLAGGASGTLTVQ